MMSDTPPYRAGWVPRHSADPTPREGRVPTPGRYSPPSPNPADRWPSGEYYPSEDDLPTEDEMPTDPTLPAPLNFAPAGQVSPRYQDLVIPRVYVEPDELLDRLRRRALRWAIARDVLAVIVLMYLIGWMARMASQVFL